MTARGIASGTEEVFTESDDDAAPPASITRVEVSFPEDDLFTGVRPGPHTALFSGRGAAGRTAAY